MLKPLHNNIIVKPINKNETTNSGIILPDTIDKEKPEKGTVIAIGEGKLLKDGTKSNMSVKVGDQIIFSKYSPTEIKENNETLLILSENDVLAIIE